MLYFENDHVGLSLQSPRGSLETTLILPQHFPHWLIVSCLQSLARGRNVHRDCLAIPEEDP